MLSSCLFIACLSHNHPCFPGLALRTIFSSIRSINFNNAWSQNLDPELSDSYPESATTLLLLLGEFLIFPVLQQLLINKHNP